MRPHSPTLEDICAPAGDRIRSATLGSAGRERRALASGREQIDLTLGWDRTGRIKGRGTRAGDAWLLLRRRHTLRAASGVVSLPLSLATHRVLQ